MSGFVYFPKRPPKEEECCEKLRRACDLLKEVIDGLDDTPFEEETEPLIDASDAMEDFYNDLTDTLRRWEEE